MLFLKIQKLCLPSHLSAAAHLCLIATAPALVGVCAGVGDGHEAAQVADVDLVRVRCLEKPFLQELCCAVSDLTITFHLSKSKPTIT